MNEQGFMGFREIFMAIHLLRDANKIDDLLTIKYSLAFLSRIADLAIAEIELSPDEFQKMVSALHRKVERDLAEACESFDRYNDGTPEDAADMLADMPVVGNA